MHQWESPSNQGGAITLNDGGAGALDSCTPSARTLGGAVYGGGQPGTLTFPTPSLLSRSCIARACPACLLRDIHNQIPQ